MFFGGRRPNPTSRARCVPTGSPFVSIRPAVRNRCAGVPPTTNPRRPAWWPVLRPRKAPVETGAGSCPAEPARPVSNGGALSAMWSRAFKPRAAGDSRCVSSAPESMDAANCRLPPCDDVDARGLLATPFWRIANPWIPPDQSSREYRCWPVDARPRVPTFAVAGQRRCDRPQTRRTDTRRRSRARAHSAQCVSRPDAVQQAPAAEQVNAPDRNTLRYPPWSAPSRSRPDGLSVIVGGHRLEIEPFPADDHERYQATASSNPTRLDGHESEGLLVTAARPSAAPEP